jgi:hypothetical protein
MAPPHLGLFAIVLIAAGGYEQAGISRMGEDNFPLPLGVRYWANPGTNPIFTGGEAHAYMIHQFLTNHRVTPIPALWLMSLGAIGGAGLQQFVPLRNRRRRHRVMGLSAVTGLYGIGALQLYIASGLLLPIVLPTAILWLYLV